MKCANCGKFEVLWGWCPKCIRENNAENKSEI